MNVLLAILMFCGILLLGFGGTYLGAQFLYYTVRFLENIMNIEKEE